MEPRLPSSCPECLHNATQKHKPWPSKERRRRIDRSVPFSSPLPPLPPTPDLPHWTHRWLSQPLTLLTSCIWNMAVFSSETVAVLVTRHYLWFSFLFSLFTSSFSFSHSWCPGDPSPAKPRICKLFLRLCFARNWGSVRHIPSSHVILKYILDGLEHYNIKIVHKRWNRKH